MERGAILKLETHTVESAGQPRPKIQTFKKEKMRSAISSRDTDDAVGAFITQPECYKLFEQRLVQLSAASETMNENMKRLGGVNESMIR